MKTKISDDFLRHEEETTADVIIELGDDVDRCQKNIIDELDKGDDEFETQEIEFLSRQLIRAVFAFIEAVTFSVKAYGVNYCLENDIEVSWAERYLAVDIDHVISNKGEVIERPAYIKLADNIRFAFNIQEKALNVENVFDPTEEWWAYLKSSIKVRNRITHPRFPRDIFVSADEVLAAQKAFNGFKNQLDKFVDLRK